MILVSEGSKQYFIEGSMLDNVNRTNSMTSYPTVEGTSFSDHYYREPDMVSFQLFVSGVSRSLIYSVESDRFGGRIERRLSAEESEELVKRWFKDATEVEVTSNVGVKDGRLGVYTSTHFFPNMRLQSYSWSDQDLALFKPTLTFKEARVQTLRRGVVENPDQYYKAFYGDTISLGGTTAVTSQANIGDAFRAGVTGAAVGAIAGAAIGSIIPGVGTGIGAAVGAIAGGAIGFFGSLF